VEEVLAVPHFDNWLVGFIEAEGSFYTFYATGETNATIGFNISQTNGLQIITAICKRLGLNKVPYHNTKTDSFTIYTTDVFPL
jgi:hypothetical protein